MEDSLRESLDRIRMHKVSTYLTILVISFKSILYNYLPILEPIIINKWILAGQLWTAKAYATRLHESGIFNTEILFWAIGYTLRILYLQKFCITVPKWIEFSYDDGQ